MAGDHNAGSVWVQFKGAVSGLVNGFKQALGGLDTFERGANKSFARIAKFSNKLLHVQFAAMSLMQAFGSETSGLGQAVKFASAGIATFAITASILPGSVGLLIAVLAGLATAFAGFLAPSEEAKAALERTQKVIKASKDSYGDLNNDLRKIENDFSTRRMIGTLLGEDLSKIKVEEAIAKVKRFKETIDASRGAVEEMEASVKKLLANVPKERAADASARSGSWGNWGDVANKAAGIDTRTSSEKAAAELEKKITAEKAKQYEIAMKELKAAFDVVVERVKAGLAMKAQASAALAIAMTADERAHSEADTGRELEAQAEALLKIQEAFAARQKSLVEFDRALGVQRALESVNAVLLQPGKYLVELLNEGTRIAQEQARQAEMNAWAGTTGPMSVEDRMGIVEASQAAKEKARKKLEDMQEDFRTLVSDPFSHSLADGVRDGILAGSDALEMVRNTGENMFRESITTLVEFGRKNLATALTDLLGAGGEVMGSLMAGVMGVVGFFMSGRGGKSGSQSWSSVSGITSTAANRGIVAGPSSVAIAAVGDDLARAFAPVVSRLDSLIGIGTAIASKVGGGGGLSYAGDVPS